MFPHKRINRLVSETTLSTEGQFYLRRIDKKFLVCLWAGLFVLCGWWWVFDVAPADILKPVTLILILSCFPILDLMRRGKGIVLDPAVVFCATFIVVYAFSAFNSFDSIYVDLDMELIMPRALWWACLGLALFLIGYYLPLGNRLAQLAPSLRLKLPNRSLQSLCWVCILILTFRYLSFYLGIGLYTSFLEGFDLLLVSTLTILAFSSDPPSSGTGSKKWHVALACIVISFPA